MCVGYVFLGVDVVGLLVTGVHFSGGALFLRGWWGCICMASRSVACVSGRGMRVLRIWAVPGCRVVGPGSSQFLGLGGAAAISPGVDVPVDPGELASILPPSPSLTMPGHLPLPTPSHSHTHVGPWGAGTSSAGTCVQGSRCVEVSSLAF
ncbi:hypothetical protein ATANTOWER_003562 [Ataeniobius toweri]|uniref:Uncharacterized protein n=1 Tax=Ataeniobius toweri TaxID=208326 RepID=A0ABU7BMV8_9TELE|nr:hypothetical protein [Ataeniobius toweri]